MKKYKIMMDPFTKQQMENQILRVEDNACIPFDINNTDYQNYLKWLDGYELQGRDWVKTSDSNTPEPADPPTT